MTEQFGEFIASIGLLALVIAVIVKVFESRSVNNSGLKMICRDCGSISQETQNSKLRGSGWITFILLLCYIVPGLIYMIWRRGDKAKICAKCGSKNIIPADSPIGKKLLNELNN